MLKFNNPLNIIYLCTAEKGPSGGAKIIYDHSSHINKLKIPNISSEVLHIKKKGLRKWNTSIKKILNINYNNFSGWSVKDIDVCNNFKSKWFKNEIKTKNDFIFDKKKDFIIFPEIFAHFAKRLCIDKNVPYAIFALNGYSLNITNDYKTLDASYKNSKFILSVSNDINKCLKVAFPKYKNKILKTSLSVDNHNFKHKRKKNNLITYMPRKLSKHSELVLFFLRNKLTKNWKIKSIHNLKEKKVYEYLLKSKIFLSFTQFEGLGMPPIEAALAGNKIIGYTGEGGKEIWKKPIFSEIPSGNILKFVNEILKNIKKIDLKNSNNQRIKIAKRFSIINEKKNIIKMLNKIRSLK